MFRLLPLPDAINSLNAGATQSTYNPNTKPAGEQVANNSAEQTGQSNVFTDNQQNPDLSKVTIFASLDSDSSGTVNKSEAFGQLNQGFKAQSGIMSDSVKTQFTKQGITDVSQHLKNLYFNLADNLNIASGKKEVTSAEVDATKSELDTNTENLIKTEINKINSEVQNQYEQMLADAIQKSSLEQISDDIKTGNNRMEPLFSNKMEPMDSTQLAFDGIHPQTVNHNGTRIKGAGIEHTNGDSRVGFKMNSTNSATAYVQKGKVGAYANINPNARIGRTAEGGILPKNKFTLGVKVTI